MAIKLRNKVSASFSMSSMTDIVFLLLIFFMITSTLVYPTALKLVLPQKKTALDNNNKKDAVQIFISGDLQYSIKKNGNFRKFGKTELEQIMSDIPVNENTYVALHPEENVPIENVVEVMDIAKTNGIKLALKTSVPK